MIIFTKTNELTGKKNRLQLRMSASAFSRAYNNWQNGMLIDDAFPKLSNDEREFIQTGMLPGEWDALQIYLDYQTPAKSR